MTPHIILGPPGTGKTTRLLEILDEEIRTGTPPSRIAFVSFTREGAWQGASRALSTYKNRFDKEAFCNFRTIHSTCFRALEATTNEVMQKSDFADFGRKAGFRFTGQYSADLLDTDDKYLFVDTLLRNNRAAARPYIDTIDVDRLVYIRKQYANYKNAMHKMDFTDMLQRFVEEQRLVDVDVAFVDEAQDLTQLQWRVVWTAFRNVKRLYIAGDDDQAIYQWSGADVDHFLGIDGTVEVLSQSHRIPEAVHRFAQRIVRRIEHRAVKEYHPAEREGLVRVVNEFQDIAIDKNRSYLFLARTNALLEPIHDWLYAQSVAHIYKETSTTGARKIAAVREYMRKGGIHDPEAPYMKYLRDDAQPGTPWQHAFSWPEEEIGYYAAVLAGATGKVRVATIHSVKGAEADVVVVLSDMGRRVHRAYTMTPDAEHRVFYVAATRAKHELHIVYPQSVTAYDWLKRR